jgi:hypothetical protein
LPVGSEWASLPEQRHGSIEQRGDRAWSFTEMSNLIPNSSDDSENHSDNHPEIQPKISRKIQSGVSCWSPPVSKLTINQTIHQPIR